MQYSRGYIRLLAIGSRYRFIYTIAACAMFFCAWYLFWYMPYERQLQQTGKEINRLRSDSERLIEQRHVCKQLAEQLEQFQKDVASGDASLAASQDISIFMRYIKDAGLQLISLRTSDRKDHGWYVHAHIVLDAIGTLSGVYQFFQLLQKNMMPVQCDELSLQRKDEDTFRIHAVIKHMLPQSSQLKKIKSPSTLKKAEGLGG